LRGKGRNLERKGQTFEEFYLSEEFFDFVGFIFMKALNPQKTKRVAY